jgi:phage terminase Nu1 subunit (DNA packaging protein)
MIDLSAPCGQRAFGTLVGLSDSRVSRLVSDGTLRRGATAAEWIRAYAGRQREAASGQAGNLADERAALTRSQRVAQDIKNRVAEGEFAPVSLLTDALANASAAVAARFDGMRPYLRRRCPDLTEAHLDVIERALSEARAQWVADTVSLVEQRVDELADEPDAATDS